ncbi:MAG: GNAT family N-acetyltransferase [Verrucomicrobiota bacterium]
MLETVPALELEELTSGGALRALVPEWERLWENTPAATPFQMPGWLLSWWKHFGAGKKLWVLILREAGELVGVAPLCIHVENGVRKVLLIGVAVSDYLDALFAPEVAETGATLVFEHLARHAARWDVCDLQPLLEESALLSAELPAGLRSSLGKTDTCTRLELSGDPARFRTRFSAHFRKRLSAARRNAEALGAVRFELASAQTFPMQFDILLRLHRSRWKTRNEPGLITNASAEGFHRDAAHSLLKRGALRLWTLQIGARPAAALHAFVHRRRLYAYLSGLEPEFEKASPGVLLIMHAIEQAMLEGVIECDFLRGREAYKYRWAVREFPTCVRHLVPA